MFYKPKAKKLIENFLHRYDVRVVRDDNEAEIVFEYTFLAKGKQLPLDVIVRERQERGVFGARRFNYESKSKNTKHTSHFNTVEKLVIHLVVMQTKKDRMGHK